MDSLRRASLTGGCAVLVIALSVCSASPVFSQGAFPLQYPISARSAGMGETGAADNTDPANIFFNPANVVGPQCIYVNGSRWGLVPQLADDVWMGRVGAGVRWGGDETLGLGADITYGRLDYGESIITDPFGNPLAEVDSHEDYIALTVGAGLKLGTDWELRIGAGAKRYAADLAPAEVTEDLADTEFDAFAFDVGATLARPYDLGQWAIIPAIAVACVNFGGDIETDFGDDPLPTRLHFGTSARVESPTAHLLGADVPVLALVYNVEAVERMHDSYFSWGIGGELALAQMVFVRAGTSDIEDEEEYQQLSSSGWGLGVGLPIGPVRTRFDYTKTSSSYDEKKLGVSIDWIF